MVAPIRRKLYTLPKKIAALRIADEEAGTSVVFTQLPKGTELEIEPETPDLYDRMINVRCKGHRYGVFINDIEQEDTLSCRGCEIAHTLEEKRDPSVNRPAAEAIARTHPDCSNLTSQCAHRQ